MGNMTPQAKPRGAKRIEVMKHLLDLDESKMYRNIELILYLIGKGFTHDSADQWVKVLTREGYLKRVAFGLYQIEKEKIKKDLEYLISIENKKKEKKEVEYA